VRRASSRRVCRSADEHLDYPAFRRFHNTGDTRSEHHVFCTNVLCEEAVSVVQTTGRALLHSVGTLESIPNTRLLSDSSGAVS
jgi:hypothetical protein